MSTQWFCGSMKILTKKWKNDLVLVFLLPSIVLLVFYGVLSQQLAIKDALTFLMGLLSGTGIGVQLERKS